MDQYSIKEIEKIAWTILKDAGLTEPPIKSDDLIDHLKLNLDFYSLDDPSFVRWLTHKFKVQVNHVKKAIKKSNLVAAWLPDSSKIVIDGSLPEKKQIWPQFHEISHSVLPWHKEFFLGDTAQMLDPEYQELLEEEANYGASELMFCGPCFRTQMTDYDIDFKSIKILSKEFETTLTTTLRKFIISQEEVLCFASISTPPWSEDENATPGELKHLVGSKIFSQQFGKPSKEDLATQINDQITYRSGGPVGSFVVELEDINGDFQAFECETFYNTFEILTLGICDTSRSQFISI